MDADRGAAVDALLAAALAFARVGGVEPSSMFFRTATAPKTTTRTHKPTSTRVTDAGPWGRFAADVTTAPKATRAPP
ncbi:MAG TPA: hypothetical protein VG076_14600 [Acidimicrobiales bacterium]|nr:hypothetical protein [Acidimicrobiales bacterium]